MKSSPAIEYAKRNHHQAAFGHSLIEVLAALALASILMVSVLQLLKNLHARERLVDRAINLHSAWQDRLFQLLERDLRNSRRIRISSGMFELEGHCGTDPLRGLPDLTEAVVTWRVAPSSTSTILVREERPLTLSTNLFRREVIAAGINDVSFWYQEAPEVPYLHSGLQSGIDGNASGGTQDDWAPMPKAIICRVEVARGNQSTMTNRTIIISGGGPR